MFCRVSHIEAYRKWKSWSPLYEGEEEPTVDDLVRFITVDQPTEAMLAGTAFHKAIELAADGEYSDFEALGYKFHMPDDATVELPPVRELRGYAVYGDLTVSGQCDGLSAGYVVDHKTTKRFDAERYLNGCQWKFYLEIFKLDAFRWNIFEIKEVGEKEYSVSAPHILTAYRYPEMPDHCAELAADYLAFAKTHLPEDFSAKLSNQLAQAEECA